MPTRYFLLAWVLVNTLCWAMGFALLTPLDARIHWSSGLTPLHIGVSALMGAMVGVGQWAVLRTYIEKAKDWAFGSALGFGIGLPLASRVALGHDAVIGQLLAFIMLGSSVGLAQWFTVQRQVPGMILWMAGVTLGWSAGIGATMLFEFSRSIMELYARYGFSQILVPIADGLTNGMVVGVIYGVITGALLIWLLNSARETGEKSSTPSM